MDSQTFWDVAFLQVAAIQFHPANHALERIDEVVAACAEVADRMLELREARCRSV